MTTSDQPTGSSTGKIIGITIGAIVALVLCIFLASCAMIFLLALLGPAIGNVFSGIILDI
jgi:hypothetical protein